MDWSSIFGDSLQQGLGAPAVVYCLAAIGLNVHFGYTGLLNFGQAGFMAVAGYALASSRGHLGTVVLARAASSGSRSSVVLALLLGIPTLRLRADYLAIVTIAAAEIIRQMLGLGQPARLLRRAGRPAAVHRARFQKLNPFHSKVTVGLDHLAAVRLLAARRRLERGRAVSLPDRVPAHAQPVGPGAQGDPGGRGRRTQPRQERLRLQDAVAGHRRSLRRAGRAS